MKNKNKYDLTELEFLIGSLTDGCGRKIKGKTYVEIKHGETLMTATTDNVLKTIMQFLEEEENGKK